MSRPWFRRRAAIFCLLHSLEISLFSEYVQDTQSLIDFIAWPWKVPPKAKRMSKWLARCHTILKAVRLTSSTNKWAAAWQNQQNEGAPSEDSDQPGHPPSLIRVFAVRMKKALVLSYPVSAQRRLRLDWADAQTDQSLRWAHSHFIGFVMSRLKLDLTTDRNNFYCPHSEVLNLKLRWIRTLALICLVLAPLIK